MSGRVEGGMESKFGFSKVLIIVVSHFGCVKNTRIEMRVFLFLSPALSKTIHSESFWRREQGGVDALPAPAPEHTHVQIFSLSHGAFCPQSVHCRTVAWGSS